MYKALIPNSVRKDFRKLDKQAQQQVLVSLEELQESPHLGVMLATPFEHLRKLQFSCNGVQYRIIYQVNDSEMEILIVIIGTRENIYSELKKRL
jgi:mRNA-degrading endonuclease RelE of RelBE toxin-antitoxin system